MLQGVANVGEQRRPAELRDANPGGMWRLVDNQWSREDVNS